jgi:hypothetical protein
VRGSGSPAMKDAKFLSEQGHLPLRFTLQLSSPRSDPPPPVLEGGCVQVPATGISYLSGFKVVVF